MSSSFRRNPEDTEVEERPERYVAGSSNSVALFAKLEAVGRKETAGCSKMPQPLKTDASC